MVDAPARLQCIGALFARVCAACAQLRQGQTGEQPQLDCLLACELVLLARIKGSSLTLAAGDARLHLRRRLSVGCQRDTMAGKAPLLGRTARARRRRARRQWHDLGSGSRQRAVRRSFRSAWRKGAGKARGTACRSAALPWGRWSEERRSMYGCQGSNCGAAAMTCTPRM